MDTEKRMRRLLANSNERRRMQSINTGFNSLRTMLPKHEGEKLSKAAILQHTAEYIDSLEQEKTRLLSQLHQLKTLIKSVSNGQQDISELAKHSLVKKIKLEHNSEFNSDSSDEGIHCNVSPIEAFDNVDELKAELIEVRKTVDRERKLRMQLEDQVKALETQLYPERVKEIAQSIQVKLHHGGRNHSSSLHASASETGSMDNSENENELAVAALQDDVIAETIEIETGSCPGSPLTSIGSHQTIVIQQPSSSSNGTSLGSLTPQVIHLDPSTLRVVTASSNKNAGGKSSGQPAAIALPIEVPFMGGIVTASPATISKSNNTTTTTIHLTSNSNKTNSLSGSNTNTSNILGVTSNTASTKSSGGTPATVTTRVSSVIVSNNNTNSGSSGGCSSNSGSSNNAASGSSNTATANSGGSGNNNCSISSSTNANGNSTNNISSSNSSSSASSNGKESGKSSSTNGSSSVVNSDGKSASNSNSNSNKSSASTISSSSKQSSKQATAVASSLPPRHNLETIVEAIRHLEGDHMFKDDDSVAIEVEEEVEVPLIE